MEKNQAKKKEKINGLTVHDKVATKGEKGINNIEGNMKYDENIKSQKKLHEERQTDDGENGQARKRKKSREDIKGNYKHKARKRNKKRNKERLGTWNERTMLIAGRMEEIGRVMEEYKIEILALQEVRWAGEGSTNKDKYTLFYGGENEQGSNETAVMVIRKFKERFKKNLKNITIINVYAPTEEKEDEEKD